MRMIIYSPTLIKENMYKQSNETKHIVSLLLSTDTNRSLAHALLSSKTRHYKRYIESIVERHYLNCVWKVLEFTWLYSPPMYDFAGNTSKPYGNKYAIWWKMVIELSPEYNIVSSVTYSESHQSDDKPWYFCGAELNYPGGSSSIGCKPNREMYVAIRKHIRTFFNRFIYKPL